MNLDPALRGPGEPCPICSACARCFRGDHGSCHGCPCACQQDGYIEREKGCNHAATGEVIDAEYAMRKKMCDSCQGTGERKRAVGYRLKGRVVSFEKAFQRAKAIRDSVVSPR